MFSIPLTIERSITIDKSADEIFNIIANFNSWRNWSPWLCQEPECPVDIKGNVANINHSQSWDGKRIGAGEMRISAIKAPSRIDYDLTFLKPWKSHSKVAFEIHSTGESSTVTWSMQGSLPFFMFFMKKMMAALVGSDYERGLSMLKEYSETGEVHSTITVNNIIESEGFHFVGKRNTCKLSEVGVVMGKDFVALIKMVEEGLLPSPELTFSFYHRYDFVNQQCDYTSGFGYKTRPAIDGTIELEVGQLPKHKALQVEHTGSYRHLGNAWSTIQGMLRSGKHRQSKTIPMYEIYLNLPDQVDEKDLITQVQIPLKD